MTKRWLAVVLAAVVGCGGGKTVGGDAVVYDDTGKTVGGWVVGPNGKVGRCVTPVGTRVQWLGSGFTVPDKPGVWDRTRYTAPNGESALVYFPATNLRATPR